MARSEIRCELSWSASRAREFDRCRRESWYARYASWGWWTERPRGEKWRAMVHKNLTSLPAFTGDCVHRAIEGWFRARARGATLDAEELFVEARALFRTGWRQSAGGGWEQRPNKSVHLDEHHYREPIEKARTDAARDLLLQSSRTFCEHPDLEPVRASEPDSWRAIEALDSFELEGVKVYAVPDLAYERDGVLEIVDWKTGKPREEDRLQLGIYALYAHAKWGTPFDRVRLTAAYLGAGEVKRVPVDAAWLDEVRATAAESIARLAELHYDPDVEDTDLDRWPTDGAPRACRWCRFRGICEGALEGNGGGGSGEGQG